MWPGCSSGYLNPHLMCHRAALCELGSRNLVLTPSHKLSPASRQRGDHEWEENGKTGQVSHIGSWELGTWCGRVTQVQGHYIIDHDRKMTTSSQWPAVTSRDGLQQEEIIGKLENCRLTNCGDLSLGRTRSGLQLDFTRILSPGWLQPRTCLLITQTKWRRHFFCRC